MQRNDDDVVEKARRFSPAMFAVIAVCFFLPFVALTCAGQELFSVKGIDLVTGTEITEDDLSGDVRDSLQQFEEGFGETPTDDSADENDKLDPQLWAIVALAAAVVGVVGGLVLRDRRGRLLSAISGIVGAVSLILLRATFDVESGADAGQEIGQVSIGYEWRLGWWLALLLFLVQPLLHLISGRRMVAAGDTPLPTTPPPPVSGSTEEGS